MTVTMPPWRQTRKAVPPSAFPSGCPHQVFAAGEIIPVLVLKPRNCLWTSDEVWEESGVKGHLCKNKKEKVQAVLCVYV